MKLSRKDAEFLNRLKALLESKGLEVRLKPDGRGLNRMVLVGRYGDKLGSHLRLTRQGVYWRFQHICEGYIAAYESIYFLESTFGISLREFALQIARERITLRKKALENGTFLTKKSISRRQTDLQDANGQPSELSGESPDT